MGRLRRRPAPAAPGRDPPRARALPGARAGEEGSPRSSPRRLAGECLFLTAIGDDHLGARSRDDLGGLHGVEVHAAIRAKPHRRTFTYLDDRAERTITVLGERLVPHGDDPLPWDRLDAVDAVYFTGGDPEALRHARRAKTLVATPRAADALKVANVQVDVLVGSATDPGEAEGRSTRRPTTSCGRRAGAAAAGRASDGEGRWAAARVDTPRDSYGCGDSFAAGLTYALGRGEGLEAALEAGAIEGARCLSRRGPY